MKTTFLGDSYDLVKRFFCRELTVLGYAVIADPMFTGAWNEQQQGRFFRLIGAAPAATSGRFPGRVALFLDPDIGINQKGGGQHVSFARVAAEVSRYPLVFSFDQSFSYQVKRADVMQRKLAAVKELGCHAMYYDSHARFLFASRRSEVLSELRAHLLSVGLPAERLVDSGI